MSEKPPIRPSQRDRSGDGSDSDTPAWQVALGLDGSAVDDPAEAGEPSEEVRSDDLDSNPKVRGERRWAPIAFVAGVLVLTLGMFTAIAMQFMGGDEGQPQPNAEALAPPTPMASTQEEARPNPAADMPDVSTSQSPVPAAFECKNSREGDTVTGNGEGDTKSVAGVVLAFQHAYYVERDAEAALKLMTKDSPLTNAEGLQGGIDEVPQGTEYCVEIKTLDKDRARVKVTEARPDAEPSTFTQVVSTRASGGSVSIVDIAEEGDSQ